MTEKFIKTFENTPLWAKLLWGFVILYACYWIYAHPLAALVIKGLLGILPYVFKMLWALIKFFAILIVLQVIFAKTVTTQYRKLLWVGVIMLTSLLDSLGLFGGFSWNPLKIGASFDYFLLQMQLLSFYYIMLLLILPKGLWTWLNQGFILLLTLLSSGVSLIPIIGGFLGSLLSAMITFSILTFLVLNMVALGLLWLESVLTNEEKAEV